MSAVVDFENVTFSYPDTSIPAVNDVSISLMGNRSLGIVGESGSGKSTVARIIAGALRPQKGTAIVLGEDLATRQRSRSNQVQMIFQNPYAALNPRLTCGQTVAEAARVVRGQSRRVAQVTSLDLLREVGLARDHAQAYPRALSGGQRQRVVIARALACEPTLLVADEPTSALDVSVQAQIVNLLIRLRVERGLSLVMISHNLAVVGHLSDTVVVMRNGTVVEQGQREQIFNSPTTDYTRELLASTTFAR